jgi:2-isopropylmalate synthase
LSAVNNFIGDRPLPELKLSVGFNVRSGQADIASAIVNSLGLELPRRLQSSFFEVVQRSARDSGGDISFSALTELFRTTYGFGSQSSKFSLGVFKLEHVGDDGRKFIGTILVEGESRTVTGNGNGPLSSTLSALHSIIDGSLSIREYSEHSVGEGTEVVAASYVELSYEAPGTKKRYGWGVSTDADITASGIRAVLAAASNLNVVIKNTGSS